jgi:hypothetical protein
MPCTSDLPAASRLTSQSPSAASRYLKRPPVSLQSSFPFQILQIFLEKVDALLTRSEASMYAINACCVRVDLERGPDATGHLSQKRFMQLILTRVTRLNNNLSKMEDYMMDVYLESNVELLTEDVLLRPKLGSAAITATQYHEARCQLLERSAFQPDFVAVMHSRARASGEFFAYEVSVTSSMSCS